jgi:hypothetical protein
MCIPRSAHTRGGWKEVGDVCRIENNRADTWKKTKSKKEKEKEEKKKKQKGRCESIVNLGLRRNSVCPQEVSCSWSSVKVDSTVLFGLWTIDFRTIS